MAKCKVILADPDAAYLSALELLLLREYGSSVDVQLVTDIDYFKNLFAVPQQIATLVVNEKMLFDHLHRQDIGEMLILCEEPPQTSVEEGNVRRLYKYTSSQEIFATLSFALRRLVPKNDKKSRAKLIVLYSPEGGSGKTTVALGLACALENIGSHVLYIDTQTLQTSGSFFTKKEWLDESFLQIMSRASVTPAKVTNAVRKEWIDYLPPMQYSTAGYHMTDEFYLGLIRLILTQCQYDFVVVDTSSDLTVSRTQLMQEADHVVIPLRQTSSSAAKLAALLRNLDTNDHDKYVFLCNFYDKNAVDCIRNADRRLRINEFIEPLEPELVGTLDGLHRTKAFVGLAYRLL